MKILSKISKGLFWVLILVLLAAPLGLIFEISNREMQKYATPTAPMFVETAYGGVVMAERMDVEEYIVVSGTFQSHTYKYLELDQEMPSKIRWNISVGDEIQEGQVIGTYEGEDVITPISGMVAQMSAYSSGDAYLKIKMASPVVFECDVSSQTLISLKYAKALVTEDGEPVTLAYSANIRNSDGTYHVRLQIDSDYYYLGQTLYDLKIKTGNIYTQALVLPERCVYQKAAGERQPWYVRQVTEDGRLIKEVEVSRGFTDGEVVCVTGIEAGQFFDTGYKQIAEGR